MKKQEALKSLAEKYFANMCTQEEIIAFLDLLEAEEIDEGLKQAILRRLEEARNDERLSKRIFERADSIQHIEHARSLLGKAKAREAAAHRISRRPLNNYLKVAAVIVLVLAVGIVYLFYPRKDVKEIPLLTHQTAPGQKATVTLSDGSTVKLHSESTLIYPEKIPKTGLREVSLRGEAFFNVTPDPSRPFIVRSGELTTRVLGTSFNVRAIPDEKAIQVVVATGKVQVEDQQRHAVTLRKNEMVNYRIETKKMLRESGDFSHLLAWKDETLIFDRIELRQAAKKLERWFGIRIMLENERLGNCVVKGSFRDKNLNRILQLLKYGRDDFDYQFVDGGVILRGPGCEKSYEIDI